MELHAIRQKFESIVESSETTQQLLQEELPLIADMADLAKETATVLHKKVDADLEESATHTTELQSRQAASATWAYTQLALTTVGILTCVGLFSRKQESNNNESTAVTSILQTNQKSN